MAPVNSGSNGCLPNDPETRARAQKRLEFAVECISKGLSTSEIVQILCKEHNASWRNAYRDVARARKRLGVSIAKRSSDEALGDAIARVEAHYTQCRKSGDLRTGLETLKLLAQLTGALRMSEILVSQQINSLTIAGPTGAITAQLQGMDRGELEQFVMGRLKGNGQREVIEATAEEGEN